MDQHTISRRHALRLLAGGSAAAFATAAVGGEVGIGLQDLLELAPLPEAKIFVAKEIITMDPARPRVQAAAVVGGRIAAVGRSPNFKDLPEIKPSSSTRPSATRS